MISFLPATPQVRSRYNHIAKYLLGTVLNICMGLLPGEKLFLVSEQD
jgi:hypothetical protein